MLEPLYILHKELLLREFKCPPKVGWGRGQSKSPFLGKSNTCSSPSGRTVDGRVTDWQREDLKPGKLKCDDEYLMLNAI